MVRPAVLLPAPAEPNMAPSSYFASYAYNAQEAGQLPMLGAQQCTLVIPELESMRYCRHNSGSWLYSVQHMPPHKLHTD